MADIGTALYAYSAVLAALYTRDRTGRGAVIPIAMLDVIAEMMGFALNGVLHGGRSCSGHAKALLLRRGLIAAFLGMRRR